MSVENGRYNKISLYDWCVENNRQDILDRWDYELNYKNPSEVVKSDHDNYYFKCDKCLEHKPLLCQPANIKPNSVLECCECNSFANWGIKTFGDDFIEKFWDKELNIGINPWFIGSFSSKKVFLKCQKHLYHGSYEISCANFHQDKRCPYCVGKKVHPKDSFAQFNIDRFGKDFIKTYWGTNNEKSPYEYSPFSSKKVFIKCNKVEYHGEYETECSNFSRGQGCPYCEKIKLHKLDSLGVMYPETINIWSELNELSPYDYFPNSNKKVYWKCESDSHDDYFRSPNKSLRFNFRCPECAQHRKNSFLQEKVSNYLKDNYTYKINHEFNCSLLPTNPKTKQKLPYDNEIEDIKLIIEVHGEQHYVVSYYHKLLATEKHTTPEYELYYQQVKDRYKKLFALSKGFSFLEISYKDEKDDYFKLLIDNKISEILNNSANN